MSRCDCHINTNGERVSINILCSGFLCVYDSVYLYGGVLFGSIGESLSHVLAYGVRVLVFVSLPPMKEVSGRILGRITLIKMHGRSTVLVRREP